MTEQQHLDEVYMKRAIALAKKGVGCTHPNPRVGAVVVNHGLVVGEGWHQRAGEAHAEVNALQDAGDKARGGTIYVTLEPCAGHGKTPPCTSAILRAGIYRVVFASADPNPDMAGGGALLQAQGVEVLGGVLQAKADALNIPFFHFVRTGRAYVISKAAISLDGKLATRTHDSQWITGSAARKHAHAIRAESDAIIIGTGTLQDDNPSLTVRDAKLKGNAPLRVVLATQTPDFFETCKLLDGAAPSRMYVHVCNEHTQAWRDAGMEVIEINSLSAMLKHLLADGCLQVMVEGGGKLHASFLESELADEILLYQAPLLIGGTAAVNFWHGAGVSRMSEVVRVEDVQRRKLGDDIMIRGRLVYPKI